MYGKLDKSFQIKYLTFYWCIHWYDKYFAIFQGHFNANHASICGSYKQKAKEVDSVMIFEYSFF